MDQNKEFMDELVTEMLEAEEEERKAKIDPLEIVQGERRVCLLDHTYNTSLIWVL